MHLKAAQSWHCNLNMHGFFWYTKPGAWAPRYYASDEAIPNNVKAHMVNDGFDVGNHADVCLYVDLKGSKRLVCTCMRDTHYAYLHDTL